MSYQEAYKAKRFTADEAVRLVEPGDGIIFPITGEPPALLEALPYNGRLSGNRLFRMLLPSQLLISNRKESSKFPFS